jgi:hypothetical protein
MRIESSANVSLGVALANTKIIEENKNLISKKNEKVRLSENSRHTYLSASLRSTGVSKSIARSQVEWVFRYNAMRYKLHRL